MCIVFNRGLGSRVSGGGGGGGGGAFGLIISRSACMDLQASFRRVRSQQRAEVTRQ